MLLRLSIISIIFYITWQVCSLYWPVFSTCSADKVHLWPLTVTHDHTEPSRIFSCVMLVHFLYYSSMKAWVSGFGVIKHIIPMIVVSNLYYVLTACSYIYYCSAVFLLVHPSRAALFPSACWMKGLCGGVIRSWCCSAYGDHLRA